MKQWFGFIVGHKMYLFCNPHNSCSSHALEQIYSNICEPTKFKYWYNYYMRCAELKLTVCESHPLRVLKLNITILSKGIFRHSPFKCQHYYVKLVSLYNLEFIPWKTVHKFHLLYTKNRVSTFWEREREREHRWFQLFL